METDGVVCLALDRGECAHLRVLLSSFSLQGSKVGGQYYVAQRTAQKQNVLQSGELEGGAGGIGSKGPLRCKCGLVLYLLSKGCRAEDSHVLFSDC